MRALGLIAVLLASWCIAAVASAGRPDPIAGEEIAKVTCAACHGLDGISLVASYPNLKGQKVKYLIKQLEDFRSGARQSPQLMNPVASNLSDADIKNLAAFFSSLE
jgi:cytochrome c553